ELLDDDAVRERPQRAELKRLLVSWNARATADSTGYRLVRTYRNETEAAVWRMLLGSLNLDAPGAPPPAQFEGALWELVTQRPPHLLAAAYADWRVFLLEQVDATIAGCPQLDRCTWGAQHPVLVRHPMSGALPALAS